MEEYRKDEILHKITMIRREKMTVTGVEDVDSFDDDSVVIYTVEGVMTVKGSDFRINRLNVEDGELEIEGEINSIEYSDTHRKEKIGLLSRIFR